jgi:lipopolysaccharide biosynthesis protein
LIVATDVEFHPDAALLALVEGLYVRSNVGYDFGAWAHVVRQNPELLSAETVYLVNDSMIGPLNHRKFEHVLHRIRSNKSDVIGLTDSYEKGWHIQSYFIALKREALASAALRKFIDSIKNVSDKRGVITAYEARFAPVLQAAGLSCEVLFPARNADNQSLANWHGLIRAGLPFVKVTALRYFSRSFETRNWRRILRSEGFDPQLAEQALTSVRAHGTPAEL